MFAKKIQKIQMNSFSFFHILKTIYLWFSQKGYAQGVFWVLMITVFSAFNDVMMKNLGERLHITEISFFRFLFSLLTVIPLIIFKKQFFLFKTQKLNLHLWRGLLGAAALALCCYSVNIMPLSENTTLMFTQPLFFLPLAYFFLNERVDKYRWIATSIGFLGIIVIMQPGTDTFRIEAFFPISASILFAIISLLAKKMVKDEDSLTLLYYFGLVTTVVAFPVMIFFWITPTITEIILLIFLGIGANLIQVCIFKAFKAAEASAITPIFYTEIGISSLLGFLFFDQIPTLHVLIGALFIIFSTFMISYIETHRKNNKSMNP